MTSFKKFQPQYVSNKVSANLFELLQGYRNHLSVVEHKKTFLLLKKAFLFLQTLQQQKQTMLFINNNPKFSFLVKNTANSLNQPYSNEYWIPGLLTNWESFGPKVRSFEYCESYFGSYLKKKSGLFPKYLKQKKKLEGLTTLKTKPSALVLFQHSGNESILKEAQLLNIPVVVFTDCTKSIANVDYFLPLNTELFQTVYFFCNLLCKKS
jgi:ribosomal protein S2